MNLLEIRYIDRNEQVVELQTEEDFLQFVTQLCWDKFEWTPLLEICEGTVFVHSETWDDDFISSVGVKEWKDKNIDIERDCDEEFYKKLKEVLQIEVSVVSSLI